MDATAIRVTTTSWSRTLSSQPAAPNPRVDDRPDKGLGPSSVGGQLRVFDLGADVDHASRVKLVGVLDRVAARFIADQNDRVGVSLAVYEAPP
jgi:hypothetical protein